MSKIVFTPNAYGYSESNTQVAKIISIASEDKTGANSNGVGYRPMTVLIRGYEGKGPQAALALQRHVADYPDSFVAGKELLCTLRYKTDDPQRNIAISVSPNESTPLGARTTASDWDADIASTTTEAVGVKVEEETF